MGRVTLRAFAGINNVAPGERVRQLPGKQDPSVDLVEAVNVDLDDSGLMTRRAGLAMKVAGACHSLWAGGGQCLYVKAGTLYRLNSDYSSTALATGLSGQLCYLAVNGRIYFTDGTNTGVLDNGVVRSWGMEVPPLPYALTGTGALGAGSYQLACTYLRADGQESGAGPATSVTLPDNGALRVSWAAPADRTIVAVNVYVSEPNGMVLYLAGSADVGAAELSVAGPQLAYPLATQWLDKPPAGQGLAYANGRIYIAQGQYVFACAALGYEYCDLRDYLSIDGSRIAFIHGVAGGLYIGTERAVYFASGARLEELNLRVVVPAAAVAGSAVSEDGALVTGNPDAAGSRVLLFATAAGLCLGREDGTVTNLTTDRYQFAPGAHGAAVFRASNTLRQYQLYTT